jgi:hypothetical protein
MTELKEPRVKVTFMREELEKPRSDVHYTT